jgi:cytochrome c oxidase subunit II
MNTLKRIRWPLTGALFAGALLAARVVHAAVQPEDGLGLPRDVSEHGKYIDFLMNVTHVFNIILFVIMCAWMGIACFKHGVRHEAEYDHGSSKRSVTIALCLSAFIFAIVDGNLFVNTMMHLTDAFWNWERPNTDAETVRIEVNAHQWAWDGRYAGPDGRFAKPTDECPADPDERVKAVAAKKCSDDDVVTWNEFHVPVDTPIFFQLTSTDVIHSFYLPNFRIKMDAVPGQVNRMWFVAKQTGEYEIGCAQHCGTHHYKMKAVLTVMSKDDYKKWLAEASEISKHNVDSDDPPARWGWDWKEF